MSHLRITAVLLIALSILTFGSAKVFERCELVRELRNRNFFPADQIPTWTCIAFRESSYNTRATGPPNSDGSRDHGLFQINDRYWCSPPGQGCGVTCDSLKTDDVAPSVTCVRKVYDEWQRIKGNGYAAWSTYQFCDTPDKVAPYVAGC